MEFSLLLCMCVFLWNLQQDTYFGRAGVISSNMLLGERDYSLSFFLSNSIESGMKIS